jgi:hypothetical protein
MKKNKKFNLFVSGAILFLLVTSTMNVNSEVTENNKSDELRMIRIYDTQTGVISYNSIDKEIYSVLFEESDENLEESFIDDVNKKIKLLLDSGCINYEQASQIINKYEIIEKYNNIKNQKSLIGQFDVLNIFNGIFFKLDGEKVNSFLDLYVLNLPILNKNMSALFSVLTDVEGNGYVLTLGVFGFQYIFNSSILQNPRFSEVEGSIIGFTGILIEGKEGGLTQDQSTIMGIGMNILTYWDEI